MNDSEARAALTSLSGPLPVADIGELETQHERIRPQLRKFVRGLPARRRRQRWLRGAAVSGGFALSASLVLALWLRPPDDQPFTVVQGKAVSSEGGFTTGTAETATLRTRHGAQVALAGASRVEAVTADEHHDQVILAGGSVRVQVPSLGPGKTFSVRTPDAVVTVHGTIFEVRVSGALLNTQTCVQVTEGVVSVVRSATTVVVRAGGQFNCPENAAMQAARAAGSESLPAKPTERSSERSVPREPGSVGSRARAPAAGPSADVSLGEQNRLLAAALQAERAKNYAEAQSLLRELLTRYPSSALLPDAQRSLERVRRKLP